MLGNSNLERDSPSLGGEMSDDEILTPIEKELFSSHHELQQQLIPKVLDSSSINDFLIYYEMDLNNIKQKLEGSEQEELKIEKLVFNLVNRVRGIEKIQSMESEVETLKNQINELKQQLERKEEENNSLVNRIDTEHLQVPFYHYIVGNPYQLPNLMFFKKLVMESNDFIEELIQENLSLSVFRPMFEVACKFTKEYFNFMSRKSFTSFMSYSPIVNFIRNLLKSFGFDSTVNDYCRDGNGNILKQLLALKCESVNICGIISNELSVQTEEEWKNCILIPQIMQRRNKHSHFEDSLSFMIHGQSISLFFTNYSQSSSTICHFRTNYIKTINLNNLDDIIELIALLWSYLMSVLLRKKVPITLGCDANTLLPLRYTILLYHMDSKKKQQEEESLSHRNDHRIKKKSQKTDMADKVRKNLKKAHML